MVQICLKWIVFLCLRVSVSVCVWCHVWQHIKHEFAEFCCPKKLILGSTRIEWNDKGFLLHYFRFLQPRHKRAGVRDLRRWGSTSAAAAVIVRLPRAVSFGPIKPCKMNKLSYQLISKIIARYIQNNPEHSLHFAVACHFEPLVVTKRLTVWNAALPVKCCLHCIIRTLQIVPETRPSQSTWGQDVAFNAKSCLVNFETNLRVVVKFMTNAQLWQFGTPPAGWNFSDWWLSNSEDGVPRLCNVERRCWFSLPSFLGSSWFERVWQQPSAN